MPAAARNKGPLFAGARPAPPPPRSAPRRKVRCFLAALETAPCSPASTGKARSATGGHRATTALVPFPPSPHAPGHRHRKAHSRTRDKGARPLGGPARCAGCHMRAGVCARCVTRVRGGSRHVSCACAGVGVRSGRHACAPAVTCVQVSTYAVAGTRVQACGHRASCMCAGACALGVICAQVCVDHVSRVCRSCCVHRLGTCIWHTCVPACVHQVSRVCRCQHVHWLSRVCRYWCVHRLSHVCRCRCMGCHACAGVRARGVMHVRGVQGRVRTSVHAGLGGCVRACARGPCTWGCCARVGVRTRLHTRVHGAVVHGSSKGCATNPACAPQF